MQSTTDIQDMAIKEAGELLIKAFPATYGKITFNLQGPRKSVHANVKKTVNVELAVDFDESKIFDQNSSNEAKNQSRNYKSRPGRMTIPVMAAVDKYAIDSSQ